MKQNTEVKLPNNIAQLPKKAEENKTKQLWEKSFHRIPEVLTLTDVATYLRVSESNVKLLVEEVAEGENPDIQLEVNSMAFGMDPTS